MDVKMLLIYVCCIIGIIIIGKIFIAPIKILLKFVMNSVLGVILLYAINLVGNAWGLHIGVNFITAIITGLLGIPRSNFACFTNNAYIKSLSKK